MFKKWNVFALVVVAVVMVGCAGRHKEEQPLPPAAPAGTEAAPGGVEEGEMAGVDITQRSIYFDFDKSDIKPEYTSIVENHAKYLSAHPTIRVRLEGNADERGTREYNIGLGERRANAVLQALMTRGVSQQQVSVVSYGEERATCTEHTEDCWQKNRRVDIVYQ